MYFLTKGKCEIERCITLYSTKDKLEIVRTIGVAQVGRHAVLGDDCLSPDRKYRFSVRVKSKMAYFYVFNLNINLKGLRKLNIFQALEEAYPKKE